MHRLAHFILSHKFHISCFFLICLPICYSEWVISILLSSRSLTHSSVLFSFLLVVFSLVFILAAVFSNSDWLLFIVPGFLLQWSTFLSIAFLNPFSIFITLFWTQGLVDWKGLFHCFFQGIFLFFYWGTSSPLFFLYFSDSELRKNSYLLWSWRAIFIWECRLHESNSFGARAVIGMDACHVFSLGCAGHCPLGGGYDWCFGEQSLHWMLSGASSLPIRAESAPQLLN